MQFLFLSIQAHCSRLIALVLAAPLISCAQLPIEQLDFTSTRAQEDSGYLLASITTNGTGEAQYTFRRLNGTAEYHLSSRRGAYFSGGIAVSGKSGNGIVHWQALAPGHYELTGWRVRLGRVGHHARWLSPAGLTPLSFLVRPNEAVYLGNLAVMVAHKETIADLPKGFQPVLGAVADITSEYDRDISAVRDGNPEILAVDVRASVKRHSDWQVAVARP